MLKHQTSDSAKNSTATVTSDHESVNKKQFDFSEFNVFFTKWCTPEEAIECLQNVEITLLKLCVANAENEWVVYSKYEILNHTNTIDELIATIKSLTNEKK
jgi:hypothetical protein